jgi:capsular exopolysaccharide synthesis family protein
VALTDEHCLAAEKFRMFSNRLATMRHAHGLKVVQIVSSVVGEGKSTVSANLAVTLARRPGEHVLLLEGDLRRPSLAQVLGIKPLPGLGEWWDKGAPPSGPQLYRINDLRLWLLPSGVTDCAGDILLSPQIPALLTGYAKLFDWVIVDSPPLLPLADASLWARWVDGTLLVVRTGVPTKSLLQKGLESLDKARLIGVLMNEAPDRDRVRYYDQYYGPKGKRHSTGKAHEHRDQKNSG